MFDWIYAHRGIWRNASEHNSLESVKKADSLGFAIETDVRIIDDRIIIGHDPYRNTCADIFEEIVGFGCKFAFNLKCDGMLPELLSYKNQILRSGSFVFDGSIPEMLKFRNSCVPYALRLSEFERELPRESDIVWVDGFYSDWYIDNFYIRSLMQSKLIVIVSPEIHKREKGNVWDWVLRERDSGNTNLNICTDYPVELADMN